MQFNNVDTCKKEYCNTLKSNLKRIIEQVITRKNVYKKIKYKEEKTYIAKLYIKIEGV